MSTAATIDVELRAEVAKLAEGVKAARKEIASLKESSDAVGGAFKTLGKVAIGTFGAATVLNGIKSFALDAIRTADAIGDAAERAGVAASTLSKLANAARESDVEFTALAKGIRTFQVNISDAARGSSAAIKAFEAIGINISDIRSLKPEQQIAAISDAFSKISDPADRTRIAMDLFGKSGSELVPLLLKGSTELNRLTESAVALDDRAVKALDKAGKGITGFAAAVKTAMANDLGNVVADFIGSGDKLLDLERDLTKAIDARFRALARSFPTDDIDNRIVELEKLIKREKDLLALQETAKTPKFASNHQRIGDLGLTEIVVGQDTEGDVPGSPGVKRGVAHDPFEEITKMQRRSAALRAEAEKAYRDQFKQGEIELTEFLRDQSQKRIDDTRTTSDSELQIRSNVNDIFAALTQGRASFEIDVERLKSQHISVTAAQLIGNVLAGNKRLAKAQKAFAIAQTVWETSRAVMAAAPNPYIMFAAAAMGVLQLAKINQTNYSEGGVSGGGGGGGFSGGSMSTSTQSVSAPRFEQPVAKQSGTVNVYLEGMVGTKDFAYYLANELKDLINNRDVHLIDPYSSQGKALRGA